VSDPTPEPQSLYQQASLRAYRVAFPRRWWYPACQSAELGRKPLGITIMDTPVVLFRDGGGRPRALVDRCPHRNLALSLGRVHADGCLECAYHGWRFDGAGRCTDVPGLDQAVVNGSTGRHAFAHATTERDGFVWTWGQAASEPEGVPFSLPAFSGRAGQVVLRRDLDCSLHAALENALDVPHTAHVHRGLFRGGEPSTITAARREVPGGIEVQYLGEPVRFGGLRLPNAELRFDHWDRFFLPSIAQIEYGVPGWLRLVNTIVHLPLSPFRTRAWFVVRFQSRFPTSVVRAVVAAQARRILRQDTDVLARQTANIRRFGEARFTSTDLDVIGSAVWRLLRQSERAEAGGQDAPDGDEPAGGPITFRA
jgi:phenylpropionate dioxygenase-like ring-hydroxylating dioxygenase large terminal subunit